MSPAHVRGAEGKRAINKAFVASESFRWTRLRRPGERRDADLDLGSLGAAGTRPRPRLRRSNAQARHRHRQLAYLLRLSWTRKNLACYSIEEKSIKISKEANQAGGARAESKEWSALFQKQ